MNTSATAAAVDAHLDMLRPAITSYGATVQVWLGYPNPNPSLPIGLVFVGGVPYVCGGAGLGLKPGLDVRHTQAFVKGVSRSQLQGYSNTLMQSKRSPAPLQVQALGDVWRRCWALAATSAEWATLHHHSSRVDNSHPSSLHSGVQQAPGMGATKWR